MHEPCYVRQLYGAVMAACFAPVAVYCARLDARWILAAGILVWGYYLYMWYLARQVSSGENLPGLLPQAFGTLAGRILQGFYAVWFFLLACFAANQSASAFPTGRGFPFIPVVLILLAVWAVGKGVAVVARCGSIVFCFLTATFLLTMSFGFPEIRWEYLGQAAGASDGVAALAVFFLPSLVLQLRDNLRGQAATGIWTMGLILLAVAVGLLTIGTLGQAQAKAVDSPFYLVVEGISIFGVMERFEALISAALTTSYFIFLCLACLSCAQNLKKLFGFSKLQPIAQAVAGAILLGIWGIGRLQTPVLLWGSLLFCGMLPELTLGIVWVKFRRKKAQKGIDKGGSIW